MKVLLVLGTRPQYVKYAAVAEGLMGAFDVSVIDTGQHYDAALSSDFVGEFSLDPPDYDLDAGGGSSSEQVGEILLGLAPVLEREGPDALVCMGDTNSTLAAALAGAQAGVPVGHLEAGERSFDAAGERVKPWSIPEETNRVLVDRVSSLLACSSRRAVRNLEAEAIPGHVAYTGDIMYDLYLEHAEKAMEVSDYPESLGLPPKGYLYATVHRAINTENRTRLKAIMDALIQIENPVVIPLHPRTEKALQHFGLWRTVSDAQGLVFLEPVSWGDSIALNRQARMVVTDSGGVIREAYFGGVPSVFVDDTTEWFDVVEAGWSVLAGADVASILMGVDFSPPSERPELFGSGDAVDRTVSVLREWSAG